ncbi:MAG: CPBP family intramembrane glutamic endopeptidase [Pseudomonadota bacterium]
MNAYREPFQSFVAPAAPSSGFGRLGVGVLGVIALYVLFFILYDSIGRAVLNVGTDFETATGVFWLLFSFITLYAAVIVVVRFLHQRSAATLVGPLRETVIGFWVALRICAAVQAVLLLVALSVLDIEWQLNLGFWLLLMPLACAGLFIQTGAEEIVFRGYLLQQSAASAPSPWVWGLGPAILFAAAHYSSSIPPGAVVLVMVSLVVFALLATDLVAISGNIGAAWGMHFASNFVWLLIIGTDISGLALFQSDYSDQAFGWLTLLNTGALMVAWHLIRQRLTGDCNSAT